MARVSDPPVLRRVVAAAHQGAVMRSAAVSTFKRGVVLPREVRAKWPVISAPAAEDSVATVAGAARCTAPITHALTTRVVSGCFLLHGSTSLFYIQNSLF